MYHVYLFSEDVDRSDAMYTQFLKEYDENICPNAGDIAYPDGKIRDCRDLQI